MLWLFFNLAHAELPLPIYPECGEIDRPDLCPAEACTAGTSEGWT